MKKEVRLVPMKKRVEPILPKKEECNHVWESLGTDIVAANNVFELFKCTKCETRKKKLLLLNSCSELKFI